MLSRQFRRCASTATQASPLQGTATQASPLHGIAIRVPLQESGASVVFTIEAGSGRRHEWDTRVEHSCWAETTLRSRPALRACRAEVAPAWGSAGRRSN